MSLTSREPRVTPHVYDRDRDLFERVYREGNTLVRASIELDRGLDALSPLQLRNGEVMMNVMDPMDLANELIVLSASAIAAAEKADADNEGTWTDFLRFASQTATIGERVRAEAYFMSYESFSQRHELVNGVSAKFAKIIQYTLAMYDETEQKLQMADSDSLRAQYSDELRQLRGGLSELTLLSLANYDEVSSRLALTPKVYDDLYGKTDIMLFHTKAREKESYKTPIQVKTTRQELNKNQIPENGFALFLSDYDPDKNNTLAKLLVVHFEDPSKLTSAMEQYVIDAKNKLNEDIRAAIDRQPGFLLPQIQNLPKENPQLVRRVAELLGRFAKSEFLMASHPVADQA